jgi:arylsulfatase A-like enzyme
MFVHFPAVDSAGHSKGWGSPDQLEAIAVADAALKRVLDAYRANGTLGETMIIVSADHGGAGRTHGPEDIRSRTIPWICVGPGVRHGYDLSLQGKSSEVQTFDTFSTAAYVLGVAPDKSVDGKVQMAVFAEGELITTPATRPAPR